MSKGTPNFVMRLATDVRERIERERHPDETVAAFVRRAVERELQSRETDHLEAQAIRSQE